MPKLIELNRCRQLFNYDPETGVLTFKVKRGPKKAGDPVGSTTSTGHLSTAVDGIKTYVHRICYAMHHDVDISNLVIDHIDRDPSNNRIDNLRAVSQQKNCMNDPRKDQPSLCYFSKGKWQAQVKINGVTHYLGRFKTKEEATTASMEFKHEKAREKAT